MNSRQARTDAEKVGEDSVLSAFRGHLVPQRHAEYTEGEHAVWRQVLARNEWLMENYEGRVPPAYLEGMQALELPNRLPRVEEINERLAPIGWKTVCVEGYIPTAAYVSMMSASIFPISRTIRLPEHVDFAPAPDMVHDILGHLPLLFMPEHRDFLKRLAGVMMRARPNALDAELYEANLSMSELRTRPGTAPRELAHAESRVRAVHRALKVYASELTHLARMYLWSVEFGLIGSADDFSICGAGLLSSPTEFAAICESEGPPVPYALEVIHRDIEFSDLQNQYFVARDFDHLLAVLEDYEDIMQSQSGDLRSSEIREIRPSKKARSGNA